MIYKRIFKESESKDLFITALQVFKKLQKDAEYDYQMTSNMKTSVEVQRYKNKFDKNFFEIQSYGLFNKLKNMTNELPKSFINSMIKKWNSRSLISSLEGNSTVSDVSLLVSIVEDILKKLK